MPITPAGGSPIRRPARAMALAVALVIGACGDASTGTTTTASSPPDAADVTGDSEEPAEPAELDIQGHRGARGLRPENTLPGFEAALDLEVITLEMDLHLSADGIVMVWHDPVIDADKCGLDPDAASSPPDPDDADTPAEALRISNLTAVELAGYRCDRNPDPDRFPEQTATAEALAGDDYHIPMLDEVFRFVAEYTQSDLKTPAQRANAAAVGFNIETKRKLDDPAAIGDGFDGQTPGRFEREVLAAVERAGVTTRTVVQSFDHRSLWALRRLDSTIRLAALTIRGDIPDFAELAAAGAAIWSPDYRSVDATTLDAAHASGLAVIPWTVNDPGDMQDLIDLGVDGIITDRPDLAPEP